MNRQEHTVKNLARRKARVRKVVKGTAQRPRLSVYVSNIHISAQIIDDSADKTLVSVTTVGAKAATGSMTDKAAWVGTQIATQAKSHKISKVVFDRNGRLYHGRIKALADNARAGGLEF